MDVPDKDFLRRMLRQRRRELPMDRVVTFSHTIGLHVLALPVYRAARRVALYQSIHNEVDTDLLIRQAWYDDVDVLLPRVVTVPDCRMVFATWCADDVLQRGAFGILEPAHPQQVLPCQALADVDILCVPLLGFDRSGRRLGYGAGCYDRCLAAIVGKRPVLIGLAYSMQEVDSVPCQSYELRLDYVVTEREVMSCSHPLS